MESYRSRSYADGRSQIDLYGNSRASAMAPQANYDLRSYSASYVTSSYRYQQRENGTNTSTDITTYGYNNDPKDMKQKKGKGSGGSSAMAAWSFKDPEIQRKKRVAGYKVYAVEGKVKGSFRKSFRWFKDRYTQVAYGWW